MTAHDLHYEANETDWHGNGLCILQPSSCTVSEIAGGGFGLTLIHAIMEDLRWKELQEERIIKAPVPAYKLRLHALPGGRGEPAGDQCI